MGKYIFRRLTVVVLFLVAATVTASALSRSNPAGASSGPSVGVDIELTPDESGYWVLDNYGRVFTFGSAPYLGGSPSLQAGESAVSLDPTPSGNGYRIFTSTGRVLAYGDATHLGDLSGVSINGSIVDTATSTNGHGYWMLGSEGGVFAFNTTFYGSIQGVINDLGLDIAAQQWLAKPIVGLAPTSTGNGYWLVAADGGMFSFGDAGFFGSIPGVLPTGATLDRPVVGMVPQGDGYLLVAADGGIFNFGNSRFHGSIPGLAAGQNASSVTLGSGASIAAVTVTADRSGYTMLGADGKLWAFGQLAETLSAFTVTGLGTPDYPGNQVDCADFFTQQAAQQWFDKYRPFYGDPAGLDTNSNGTACEPGQPTPPEAPRGLVVKTAREALSIRWEPPEISGSAPIRDYLLEWRSGASGPFRSTVITGTSARHSSLSPGFVYQYRVSATNTDGLTGPPSAIASGIPLEPFDACPYRLSYTIGFFGTSTTVWDHPLCGNPTVAHFSAEPLQSLKVAPDGREFAARRGSDLFSGDIVRGHLGFQPSVIARGSNAWGFSASGTILAYGRSRDLWTHTYGSGHIPWFGRIMGSVVMSPTREFELLYTASDGEGRQQLWATDFDVSPKVITGGNGDVTSYSWGSRGDFLAAVYAAPNHTNPTSWELCTFVRRSPGRFDQSGCASYPGLDKLELSFDGSGKRISPDNKALIVEAEPSASDVWIYQIDINIDGSPGAITTIYDSPSRTPDPQLSPDGLLIALRTGTQIEIIDRNGSLITRLQTSATFGSAVSRPWWS